MVKQTEQLLIKNYIPVNIFNNYWKYVDNTDDSFSVPDETVMRGIHLKVIIDQLVFVISGKVFGEKYI